MYQNTVSHESLNKAFQVIFQDDAERAAVSMHTITAPFLKKAYHKKIFSIHPDRAKILGLAVATLEERSKQLTDAYKTVMSYILEKRKVVTRSRHRYSGFTRGHTRKRYHTGSGLFKNMHSLRFPTIPLKLGQFVFNLGIIDFKTLLEALMWQKDQEVSFRDIAEELNLFTNEQKKHILFNSHTNESFEDCALRLGFISPETMNWIIAEQKKRLPGIGDYFIMKNIITREELELIIKKQKEHNKIYQQDDIFY